MFSFISTPYLFLSFHFLHRIRVGELFLLLLNTSNYIILRNGRQYCIRWFVFLAFYFIYSVLFVGFFFFFGSLYVLIKSKRELQKKKTNWDTELFGISIVYFLRFNLLNLLLLHTFRLSKLCIILNLLNQTYRLLLWICLSKSINYFIR